jgi:bacterioferritin-associated ferredoxin
VLATPPAFIAAPCASRATNDSPDRSSFSKKNAQPYLILKTGFSITRSEMYVCCCFAVTDAHIERVLDEGATSVEEVTRACRAGGDCGSCRGQIAQMLEEREESAGPGLVPVHALSRKSCAA